MRNFSKVWLAPVLPLCLCFSLAVRAEIRQVDVAITVDISQQQAWQYLQDLTVAHHYVPNLVDTRITTEQTQGVGTSRRVYESEDDYLEETVDQWLPGQGFRLHLHRGDEPMSPFNSAYFRYQLAALSAQQTEVSLRLAVDMPWGSVGAWLADWLILPVIEDNLIQVAAGIKHYYETGTAASDADRERLAASARVLNQPAAE